MIFLFVNRGQKLIKKILYIKMAVLLFTQVFAAELTNYDEIAKKMAEINTQEANHTHFNTAFPGANAVYTPYNPVLNFENVNTQQLKNMNNGIAQKIGKHGEIVFNPPLSQVPFYGVLSYASSKPGEGVWKLNNQDISQHVKVVKQ